MNAEGDASPKPASIDDLKWIQSWALAQKLPVALAGLIEVHVGLLSFVDEVLVTERSFSLGVKLSLICEGLADESQAFEKAHELCVQAVNMEKVDKIYVGAAIDSLTSAGDFGSWLKKLYRRERVSIHLHYYERLVRLVEAKAEHMRRRADHIEKIIAMTRGRNAADQGCESMRAGMASAETA